MKVAYLSLDDITMSLYYEAVSVLSKESTSGSLKSRIYNADPNFKSKPGQIYALIVEAAKYDSFLKEVIENADFLASEPKVSRISMPNA